MQKVGNSTGSKMLTVWKEQEKALFSSGNFSVN